MSKLIKVIDNENIEISCYVNPSLCFEYEGYDDYDSYCIYKEIINPFKMFEENKRLNNIINELEKTLNSKEYLRYKGKDNILFNEGGQLYKDYIKDKLKKLKEGK